MRQEEEQMKVRQDNFLQFFLHTPGPWAFGTNPECWFGDGSSWQQAQQLVVRPRGHFQNFPGRGWIADCGTIWDLQSKANARLIAAAPDLFRYVVERAIKGDAYAECLVDEVVSRKPECIEVNAPKNKLEHFWRGTD